MHVILAIKYYYLYWFWSDGCAGIVNSFDVMVDGKNCGEIWFLHWLIFVSKVALGMN